MHKIGAEHGNPTNDRYTDSESPIGILIKAQHLPGESHSQGQQEQENPDDPGKLAGKFVSSKQNHLAHVDEDHRDHEVGTPTMDGAQEPSQRDLMIQVLQAVPSFGS